MVVLIATVKLVNHTLLVSNILLVSSFIALLVIPCIMLKMCQYLECALEKHSHLSAVSKAVQQIQYGKECFLTVLVATMN